MAWVWGKTKVMPDLQKNKNMSEYKTLGPPFQSLVQWSKALGLCMYNKVGDDEYKVSIVQILVILCNNLLFWACLVYLLMYSHRLHILDEMTVADMLSLVFECIFFIVTQYKILKEGDKTIRKMDVMIKAETILSALGANSNPNVVIASLKLQLYLLPLIYAFFIALNYSIMYAYDGGIQSFGFLMRFFLTVLIVYNRNVQMFHGNTLLNVKRQLSMVNDEINKFSNKFLKLYNVSDMVDPSKVSSASSKYTAARHKRAKLQVLISVRNDLMDICRYVNQLLGKRHLLFIGFNTAMLTFHIYIIVVSQMESKEGLWKIVYYSCTWIIFRASCVIMLVLSYTYMTDEINNTAQIVHNVLNSDPDIEIVADLEHFSLQLLHSKFIFTANGFFPIDFTLLQSIAGTVATYLVILVQFKVANTPTSK